jgi:hypothetical protein
MRKLFLSLLLASPLAAQTPVTIVNPSFEDSPPTGTYDYTCPPGWTCTGTAKGRIIPSATPVDGKLVLWMQNASAVQDLAIAPTVNTTYTLKFSVGSQSNFPVPTIYSANLLIGTTIIPGCSAGGAALTARGTLVQQTLTCTIGSAVPVVGNLFVSLTSGANQTTFDNITLTSVSSIPPNFVTFKFPVHFKTCAICDKTDDSTSQMGIFSGAVINLSQDGVAICSGTVNTNGDFSCSGPVNVTPAFVNITLGVFDASGNAITPSFTNSVASLLLTGRSSVNVVFRLDSVTFVPRGVDIYSQ